MVTFEEYLEGFRNIHTEELIGDAFYKDIDISVCMRDDGDMHPWEYTSGFPKHVLPTGIEFFTCHNTIGSHRSNKEVWVFIVHRHDDLYEMLVHDDHNGRLANPDWYYEYINAISGYLFKIKTNKNVVDIVSPPSLFDAIVYEASSGEADGPSSASHKFMPYFVERPITTKEEVKRVGEIIKFSQWRNARYNMVFKSILDVLDVFQGLYIRRNFAVWNAANLIATQWSRVYWSPNTYFGKRRLARRFGEK